MAMQLKSSPRQSGRKYAGKRYATQMSDINVTPFVDVMLVLLIVFMVAAPLMASGVNVDLPKAEAKSLEQSSQPIVVTIDGNGQIFLGDTLVKQNRLVPLLRAMTAYDTDQRIFVRGDQGLQYGQIMQVMGAVNAAGFEKVALVTELPRFRPN